MRGNLARLVLVAAIAVVALCAVSAAGGDGPPIFTLTDPAGDDHGDGTLVYPLRDDMQPGDLDLRTFSAYAQGDGTVFEVTFARPIRKPARRAIDGIGTQLDAVAKLGFYTFSVDIYIDTDRVPGSGSTLTLPGRRAAVAAANAWEKVICLTPRPYEVREAFKQYLERAAKLEIKHRKGRVAPADAARIESEVAQGVGSDAFFPTLVWVTGDRVRFFVPSSFLGGTAKDRWAYVVAVSGADVDQRLDVPTLLGSEKMSTANLGVIPVSSGKGKEFFGGAQEDDPLQPPLIDIIVPAGMTQEAVLKDYDVLTDRPVRLPGVVPADEAKRLKR